MWWQEERVGRTGRGGTKINALKSGAEALEVRGEPVAWGSHPPPPTGCCTLCSGRAAAFEAPGPHTDSPSAAKAALDGLDAPSQNFPVVPGAVGTQRCPTAPGGGSSLGKEKLNGLVPHPRYGWPFAAKLQALFF